MQLFVLPLCSVFLFDFYIFKQFKQPTKSLSLITKEETVDL